MDVAEFKNRTNWILQNWLTISTPVLKRPIKSKCHLCGGFSQPQINAFNRLEKKYDLNLWSSCCDKKEFLLNCYILDILDQHLSESHQRKLCLDIGASNWSYLPALISKTQCAWHGVEIDAYKRNIALTTRKKHAKFMVSKYKHACQYFPTSLLNIKGSYELITWFLPFILSSPLKLRGLPSFLFQPEELLNHAWHLLSPGGQIFIVNQGEIEVRKQEKLFRTAGINATFIGRLSSSFSPFQHSRHAWIAKKSN